MTVYFVRHGAVENPRKIKYGRLPGFPLSDVGRQEVQQAAVGLMGKGIEAIYASPLQRTRETTFLINAQLKVPIFFDDLLLEMAVGRYEGRPEALYVAEKGWLKDGETLAECGERVIRFLEKIKSEARYKVIAAVSHEGPVVMALLHLAGRTVDEYASVNFPTGGCLTLNYGD